MSTPPSGQFPLLSKMLSLTFPSPDPWDTLSRIWGSMVSIWSGFVQLRGRNWLHRVTTRMEHSKREFEQNTSKLSSVFSFLNRRVLWDMAMGEALQQI